MRNVPERGGEEGERELVWGYAERKGNVQEIERRADWRHMINGMENNGKLGSQSPKNSNIMCTGRRQRNERETR